MWLGKLSPRYYRQGRYTSVELIAFHTVPDTSGPTCMPGCTCVYNSRIDAECVHFIRCCIPEIHTNFIWLLANDVQMDQFPAQSPKLQVDNNYGTKRSLQCHRFADCLSPLFSHSHQEKNFGLRSCPTNCLIPIV